MSGDSPVERVLAYHERTKHHPHRYARSLGYLDWDTQPEPFRTFSGAERVKLPLAADALTTRYGDLYRPGAVPPAPVTLATLATLFELALGLSAWKEYGDARWALRCNPSSGNLHPTEGYLLTAERPGLAAGLHHYVSRDHLLERRGEAGAAVAAALRDALGADAVLVGLSSVQWREAWKYGERAYRYCQHDVGHAQGALRYAAAALGWRARLLTAAGDADVADLLGLNRGVAPDDPQRPDPEYPESLIVIDAGAGESMPLAWADLPGSLRAIAAGLRFIGRAEPPSTAPVEWEVLDEVAAAAALPPGGASAAPAPPVPLNVIAPQPSDPFVPLPGDSMPAARLVRQRRSAVAMDGRTTLPRDHFYRMLGRLMPRRSVPPWDLLDEEPRVHPVLFVHRVVDLPSGLYALPRRPEAYAWLREAMRSTFAWEPAPGCRAELPLRLLEVGDFRRAAAALSCDQEIAGDGAFSLGMLAEFGARIRGRPNDGGGAWQYPRLFREAGLLGHTLYLEAEAAGLRATGIGCYFDDSFHELLGLRDDRFQSLYHFTVGGPVEDTRLITHAPYAH